MNYNDFKNDMKILAVGLLSVLPSSQCKVLAQNISQLDYKNKTELKFNADEHADQIAKIIAEDERTLALRAENFSSVAEKLPERQINTGKGKLHTQTTLKLKITRNKRMHFSDGTVAWVAYGLVNDSQREEPVHITLNTRDKSTGNKLRVSVNIADDLNCGINKPGEKHESLEKIANNLIFAYDHDIDPRQQYDKHNLKVLKDGLNWRLNKAVKDMLKIKDGAKKLPGFVNNKFVISKIQNMSPNKGKEM